MTDKICDYKKFFSEKLYMVDHKVSVIIPCYNVAEYIDTCIKSILNQTLPIDNIEIVCVDDCSTDNTIDVLGAYEKCNPNNFIIIHCGENGKQGTARNIGMKYATGDFITFVDADDWIHPEMLESLLAQTVYYNCDFSECDFLNVTDKESFKITLDDVNRQCKENILERGELLNLESVANQNIFYVNQGFMTSAWKRVYRTSFIRKNNIKFAEHIYMEDILFAQMCFLCCKSCYVDPSPYYYYYQKPDSVMHSNSVKNYYMDVFKVSNMVVELSKEKGMFNQYKEAMGYVYLKKVFYDLSMYMIVHEGELNSDFLVIRDKLLEYFPDIKDNYFMKIIDDNETKEIIQKLINA